MEDQLHPEADNRLHPELAFQAGIQQGAQKKYETHPSLVAELEPEEKVEQVEAATEEQSEQEPIQQNVQESTQERDWRAARARADEAKQLAREKEQLEREIAFYRDQAQRNTQVQAQEDDYRTDTEKQLQRQMEELRSQVSRQEKETLKAQQQAAISRAEQRLAQDYPNIREVVSDDNIKRLEYEYPHLYNSVVSSSDVYTVGSAAYEMIIAKGIYKKPANSLSQIASNSSSRNQSKPRSASTVSPQVGESPIKQANSFMGNSISSEEERRSLYEEMLKSSRNRF